MAPRVAAIAGLVILHATIYRFVNSFNARRPAADFFSFSIKLDARIPYVGWTWVVYYAAVAYLLVGAPIVLLRLPRGAFQRAGAAYGSMIMIGGASQLLLPGRSPWPDHPLLVHRWFHEQVSYDPFVCFPSMHVALIVLSVLFAAAVFPLRWTRSLFAGFAVAVAISTLTLKEHYLVDVAAGALLAGVTFAVWRRGLPAASDLTARCPGDSPEGASRG